jgi:hypothetical protein
LSATINATVLLSRAVDDDDDDDDDADGGGSQLIDLSLSTVSMFEMLPSCATPHDQKGCNALLMLTQDRCTGDGKHRHSHFLGGAARHHVYKTLCLPRCACHAMPPGGHSAQKVAVSPILGPNPGDSKTDVCHPPSTHAMTNFTPSCLRLKK